MPRAKMGLDPEVSLGSLALGGTIPLDYVRAALGLEAVRRLFLYLDHGVMV
jgi:hypothetical protein